MNSPLTPAGNNQKMLPPGKKSFLDSFSPKLLKEVVINQKKESSKISDLKDSLAKIFKIEKKSDERQARNIKEQKLLRERQRALDEEAKSEDKKNSSLRDKINSTANATWKKSKDILGGFFSFFQDMIKMFIAYKVLDWISDPKNQQNVKNIITFLRGVFDFIMGAVDLAGKIFQGGIAGITATLDTLKKVTGGPVEVLFKIVKNVGLVFGALPAIQPAIEGLIGALKAIPQFIGKIVSTITGAILGGVDKGTDEGVASAGKESGKEAGKTAVKETGEAAGKELTEQAAKSGGKAAGEAAAKSAGKAGAKAGVKAGAKGLGKSLLKKIPGVGLVAGGAFAAGRAMKGDFLGAGLELASGVAGTLPGLGTAASVGIDAALAGRDIAKSQGIPMLAKGGLVKKPTTAVVGEAGAEAIVPLSKLGETVFGPDSGALSKTVKNIIPKFTKLLMLPFTLVGGGILAIMGGIANKFPMLKPIIGMASGFIGNVFNIPKSILRVALKGVDGLSTLARGATGAAGAFIGNLGKLFGEKDPSMSGNNPPTVRGLLADILYAVEGKKKKNPANTGGTPPASIKDTTPNQGAAEDSANPTSTSAVAAAKQGAGSQDLDASKHKGATDAMQAGQSSQTRDKFSSKDKDAKRINLKYKIKDKEYIALLNITNGDYEVYNSLLGHKTSQINIHADENKVIKQHAFDQIRAYYVNNDKELGKKLKYITQQDADNKAKSSKKKAAGGWISGPMSGYPVSLDGGLSTSFIGHGTEWVGMKKAAGGGVNSAFVIPFNTPRTVNNPGLTASRYREAKAGGYVLPTFAAGGVAKKKKRRSTRLGMGEPTNMGFYQKIEQQKELKKYAAGGVLSTNGSVPDLKLTPNTPFKQYAKHHNKSDSNAYNNNRLGGLPIVPRDYVVVRDFSNQSKDRGSPVVAGVDGKVTHAAGHTIVINKDGKDRMQFHHFDAISARVGQMVSPKTVIGRQGNKPGGSVHVHLDASPSDHRSWVANQLGGNFDASSMTEAGSTGGGDSGGGNSGGGGGGGESAPEPSGLDALKANPAEFAQNIGKLFSLMTGAPSPTEKPVPKPSSSGSSSPTPAGMQSTNPKSTPPASIKPSTPNTSGSKLTTAQSQVNQSKLENAKPKVTSAVSTSGESPTIINSSSAGSSSPSKINTHDQALSGFIYTPLGSV